MIQVYELISTEELHTSEDFIRAGSKAYCNRDLGKIVKSKRGRPYFLESDFDFNLTHSMGKMFLACSTQRIGIDVEFTERFTDISSIKRMLSSRFFSKQEKEYFFKNFLLNEKKEDIKKEFLFLWTFHEALAKACDIPLLEQLAKLNYYEYFNLLEQKECYQNEYLRCFYIEGNDRWYVTQSIENTRVLTICSKEGFFIDKERESVKMKLVVSV